MRKGIRCFKTNCFSVFLATGFLGIMLTACKKGEPEFGNDKPELYSPPKTVDINTKEGYVINQLTGDTVSPVINSFGDSIQSGLPKETTGVIISSDSVPPPQKTEAKTPLVTQVHTNAKPVSPITREINESQLTQGNLPQEASTFILKNSTGDTLPTNKPVQVSGKVVSCLRYAPTQAQPPGTKENAIYDIRYLDIEQGLSASNVTAILEDSKMNLWIGSEGGGLCRYDGAEFTTYKIYGGEYIRFIYEDKQQNIWYGGPDGLVCYNGNTFTVFTEEEGLPTNWVTSIVQDQQGIYWIGTFGGGLIRYESVGGDTAGNFTHLTIKEGLPSNKINSLFVDKQERLWIGTRDAGACWLHINGLQKNSFSSLNQGNGLSFNNVWSFAQDQNGNFWIATQGGLNYFEPTATGKSGSLTIFSKASGLPSDLVNSVYLDREGNLWCGTYGGLVKLERKNQNNFDNARFVHITEEEGLSHHDVMGLEQDHSGNLWCALYGGGINCIVKGSFSYLTKKQGMPDNKVTAMMEAKDGSLWMATFGVLIHYEAADFQTQGTITQYAQKEGLPNVIIRDLIEDQEGNIWLGTNQGLIQFETADDGKKHFIQFTTEQGLTNNVIRTLLQDSAGNIWMGTNGGGLNCLTQNRKAGGNKYSITQYTEKEGLPDNYIKDVAEDQEGILWIATKAGIVRFAVPKESESGSFTIYTEKEGLPMNYTTTFFVEETDKNHIWLSTDKGVCYFEKTQEDFLKTITYYSDKHGISDNWTWSILGKNKTGGSNTLWVPAWIGMNIIKDDNTSTRVYQLDKQDGLKGTYTTIWEKAGLMDHKNRIWWGRSKGVEMLDLNSFALSDSAPIPRLHQLDINGNWFDYWNIPDSTKKGIVYQSIASFENYPEHLYLAHNKNHLTFHFSAIDWYAPHKIKYSYIIEGLNDEWSIPTAETKADYRNLPAGKHTFKVRAIGESQTWSKPFTYPFTIRPPWWYSWWAYLTYGLMGGLVLYRAHRYQLDRRLEVAERQRLIELDQIKNRLYTNITHEFRTPLTLIHGPVALALSKNAMLEQKDIQSIHRQSERLQQLINQMLQLQKLEAGMLKPNYSYGEIIQVLRYLFGSFETWAREKNITMLFSSSLQEAYMDFDHEKLTQIVSNLVSNAIKHTPRGGKVAMVINSSPSADFLIVNVSDTGTGIDEADIPYIFDRFYQSKKASTGGTGIGLALVKNLVDLLGGQIHVESKLDTGSIFILSLPVTRHSHKTPEQASAFDINTQELHDEEINFITPHHILPGKPIVLIVEDHPEVLQFIVSCLSDDYTIMTATDGIEGLRLAYERIPDLIISDVMMPGKDGFELCNTLKTDIQTSHIPIILLTGKGDHEAMMEGISHGADAYIIKPFDPGELLLRMRKLLELRENLNQHYRKNATVSTPEIAQHVSIKENEFLQKIRVFVEEHLNDAQFNMDMLCHHMAMSHPQLHRKLTALTGESTGKFVRSVRLAKALELLKNSDLTISEIAYEIGFSEPGYFTKVFSKEFNQTPTEYRTNPVGKKV